MMTMNTKRSDGTWILDLPKRSVRDPVRAAVFGTGKIGVCIAAACSNSADVELIGAATTTPFKVGADFGELSGGRPTGVRIVGSIDEILEREDVDLVFYCGLGEPDHVASYLGQIADAGKDAVTLTGLVHPAVALGADAAAALHHRAIRGSARIVGAGWNPGFILDVLPVALGDSSVRIEVLKAKRIAEMRVWGRGVHEECGIGGPEIYAHDSPNNPLHESVAMVGDALGLDLDRIETSYEPFITRTDRSYGGLAVPPGSVAGFHKRSLGFAGNKVRIELEMYGIFGIDAVEDGMKEGAHVRIEGDVRLTVEVGGDWFGDSYPVTAFRAVRAVRPLRTLSPGLYRPDQLPLSG
jgi:2,4-diaminopentanoate dehydrogenase